MKTIETNKNTAAKNPAELRDFKKVGAGSVPGEKEITSEHKKPGKNPKVENSGKLKL